jgi:hypothetical protein
MEDREIEETDVDEVWLREWAAEIIAAFEGVLSRPSDLDSKSAGGDDER